METHAVTCCQGYNCTKVVPFLVEINVYEVRNGMHPKLFVQSKKLCADCAMQQLANTHYPLMTR